MVDSLPPAPQPQPEPQANGGALGRAGMAGQPGARPDPDTSASPPELLVVGRLVAAQGLGGELRVLPLSDFPERFTRPGPRWLQTRAQVAVPVRLRSGRQLPGKELFVVRLEGIDNRSAAEALVGQELLVPASDRPPLAPGEFHLLDLVGLEVRLLGGGHQAADLRIPLEGGDAHQQDAGKDTEPNGPANEAPAAAAELVIGRVLDLIHAGNDLLEVELNASAAGGPRRRVLIPFVEAIVPEVNLAEGWIGLTPPPGLLEL